jgi:serine/threonine protein kinase
LKHILRNIFIKNKTIKLGDFGLAKRKTLNGSIFNTWAGTPLYMSPDVWEENYTYNSDVW